LGILYISLFQLVNVHKKPPISWHDVISQTHTHKHTHTHTHSHHIQRPKVFFVTGDKRQTTRNYSKNN